ncbi:hypothetical protein F5X68DRAFT_230553 [Plectosphaerella plurivora]|uniref:DUF7735 domain-containing protein n=1 Tax=Plectosphaerella plurivora TaxID=936078 RepID=A0A9P8VCD4_9PEZI|nr:hypothetical protein F5X68DRAFT_230553 [Plectosphaerella plurivora]
MHLTRLLRGAFALSLATVAISKYVPDIPVRTGSPDLLEERQATPTLDSSLSLQTQDPWQCATEIIPQYFDVPKPTGNVLNGINSYGAKLAAPCLATATGLDVFSCWRIDPKSWCGFTTAVEPSVLSSYTTFVSAAVSFWTPRSSKVAELPTRCPVAWGKRSDAEHAWLSMIMVHAQCYLSAHPPISTATGTVSSTRPSSTTTKTTTATTK